MSDSVSVADEQIEGCQEEETTEDITTASLQMMSNTDNECSEKEFEPIEVAYVQNHMHPSETFPQETVEEIGQDCIGKQGQVVDPVEEVNNINGILVYDSKSENTMNDIDITSDADYIEENQDNSVITENSVSYDETYKEIIMKEHREAYHGTDAENIEACLDSVNRKPNPDVCYMESPVLFIRTEPNGKMVVNEDVVGYLSHIIHGMYVIAIAGKYRTGKSYIMNRFFGTNRGFELGSTVQSKTKGIWLWARPHPKDSDKTLILLDTEGLCDVEKVDEEHDVKLFSLALLLSTSLVYNAMGTLDDVILQQLHLVSELTDHINTTRGQVEDEGDDFHMYFPYFFLLLRDFFLDLTIDGIPCTTTEYMEHALKLKIGRTKKIQAYNAPRACIAKYFPNRKCFTLCKPVEGEDKLRHLESLTEDAIRPKFLEQVMNATKTIIAKTKLFQLQNNTVNGSQYVALAKEYVSCINSGAVPSISGAVDSLRVAECTRALKEATEIFEQKLETAVKEHNDFPLEEDIFINIQDEALIIAKEHFHKSSLFDDQKDFFNTFMQEIEIKKRGYIQRNNSVSEERCKDLLAAEFKTIDRYITLGSYTKAGGLSYYLMEKDSIIKRYRSQQKKGPMAEKILTQWLESRQSEENAIKLADKSASEYEDRMKDITRKQEEQFHETNEKYNKLENKFERMKEKYKMKIENLKDDFEEREYDLKYELRRAKRDFYTINSELQRMKDEKIKELEAKLKAKETTHKPKLFSLEWLGLAKK